CMNKSGVYKLFVYGSLRSGFKSDAYHYISHFFSLVGNAKVRGKLFDLGSYPAGIPSNEESFIVGELYTIKQQSEFNWAIGQLDDYEGIDSDSDEVQQYRRELVEVIVNGTTTQAWIYWYAGSVEGKPLIESGDLIQYLQQKNNPSATSAQ
ncbi:MAG TPA: gamma-glutamylcyclotransferase family protein, partial [Chitinophagaceae bacterium]|nr:gamma-glutamylcyclotransferase family protein [Chitinophagaceae bacterium]